MSQRSLDPAFHRAGIAFSSGTNGAAICHKPAGRMRKEPKRLVRIRGTNAKRGPYDVGKPDIGIGVCS